MVVFFGAVGAAVLAVLQWGIEAASLLLTLLWLIEAGVKIVRIIRRQDDEYQVVPVV